MATYNGQVTGGGLNLRASASTSSSKLTQIPNNTQIVVSDYSGNSSWYCTTYGSYSGFVLKQYVNILSNVASQSATVTGGGLNLRSYPSTSASSPVQIPNNTSLTVQTHNGTWSSTTYNGHSGFVMTKYLTIGGSTGGGGTGGTTTIPGVVGNGPNSTISAADIRNNGKSWVKDLKTTHPQIKIMQGYIDNWVNSNFSDVGHLNADGIYGDDTIYMVKCFQSYMTNPTIAVDGLVGPNTLYHIERLYGQIN